jgi:non-heme chloroperoxidase
LHPLTFTAADGEVLHAWSHGESGPKIVFLHGWTASHLEWSPFIHDLAAHFRLFRWDARAHGGHPARTRTVATAACMASDLSRMIEAFDLAGACFVGHSMGALTLWQYLHDFGSARIGSLCLIDQSPKLLTDDDWRLGIYGDFEAAHGLNNAARDGYAANGRGWQRAREALRGLPPEPLIDCWQDLVNLDLRGVLPGIDRPCLLIYGGRSNFYPVETAYWVQRQTPGARLSIHEEGNHSPHLMDPKRFVAELAAFVASVSGGISVQMSRPAGAFPPTGSNPE